MYIFVVGILCVSIPRTFCLFTNRLEEQDRFGTGLQRDNQLFNDEACEFSRY